MFVTLHINHFIPLPEFVKFCVGSFYHLLRLVEQSLSLKSFSLRWFFRSASVLKTLLRHWQFTGVPCTVLLCHFSLALVANVLSQSFSWHFRLLWWDSKWLLKAFMFLKVLLELESPQDSHCLTFTILSLNTTCHKLTKWPKITHISLPNSKTQNMHAYNY